MSSILLSAASTIIPLLIVGTCWLFADRYAEGLWYFNRGRRLMRKADSVFAGRVLELQLQGVAKEAARLMAKTEKEEYLRQLHENRHVHSQRR